MPGAKRTQHCPLSSLHLVSRLFSNRFLFLTIYSNYGKRADVSPGYYRVKEPDGAVQ